MSFMFLAPWSVNLAKTTNIGIVPPPNTKTANQRPRSIHRLTCANNSDPAPAAEEVELDPGGDEHGANTHGKDPIRRLQDADEVGEVHAVETGQEAQRQEQARDDGHGVPTRGEAVGGGRNPVPHRS